MKAKPFCRNWLTIIGPACTVARFAGSDNWEKALRVRHVEWLELSPGHHVCEFTAARRPLEALEKLSRNWSTLILIMDTSVDGAWAWSKPPRGKSKGAKSVTNVNKSNQPGASRWCIRLIHFNQKGKKIMGLTIHYSLKAQGSDAQARQLIQALHQTAQDLAFKELGPVVELSGERCECNKRPKDDPLRWLLIQATEDVEVKPKGGKRNQGSTTSYYVYPSRVMGFSAWPGEGCEESNFGLCQYPPVIATDRGPLRTGLSGWRWSSFCKTQYAAIRSAEGWPTSCAAISPSSPCWTGLNNWVAWKTLLTRAASGRGGTCRRWCGKSVPGTR